MSSMPTTVRIHQLGEPLPPALEVEPAHLSPKAQEEVKAMMRSDPAGFFSTLALAWISVAAAIALAVWAQHAAVSIAAILFIGTRQNILGLLIHEQSHRLGLASKLGDHLTNLFCAFPLLITMEGYRRVHLKHHKFYFTDHDPDYLRKQGKEWTFPQKARHFVAMLIKDLVGMNIVRNFKGKRVDADAGREFRGTPMWARLIEYGAIATALTLTGTWVYFLLYWLLPLLTVMQVIVRWGAICEHKYNLINPTLGESTPMIQPRWWEMLILPNLNFNLHIYHHWYPAIPFRKLPQVHRLYQREGLVKEQNMFRGYVAFLKSLLSPKAPAAAATQSQDSAPMVRKDAA